MKLESGESLTTSSYTTNNKNHSNRGSSRKSNHPHHHHEQPHHSQDSQEDEADDEDEEEHDNHANNRHHHERRSRRGSASTNGSLDYLQPQFNKASISSPHHNNSNSNSHSKSHHHLSTSAGTSTSGDRTSMANHQNYLGRQLMSQQNNGLASETSKISYRIEVHPDEKRLAPLDMKYLKTPSGFRISQLQKYLCQKLDVHTSINVYILEPKKHFKVVDSETSIKEIYHQHWRHWMMQKINAAKELKRGDDLDKEERRQINEEKVLYYMTN